MGKHTKLAKSRPLEGLNADELLKRSLQHLELLLSAAEETLKQGGASPALARESATVARTIASLAAELRQQEKHVTQMVERMNPDEQDEFMRVHISLLPRDRQRALAAWVAELVGSESVL